MGRRASLTIVMVLFCLWGAACTRRNDGYCCTSAELCDDVGGVTQQCPSGQLCDDDGSLADGPAHTCVPDPSATDCTGPDDCAPPTPACVDEICVECDQDEHCETALAPVCDLDLHRCGDCTDNGQCERFGGGVCGPEGNCVECTPGAVPIQTSECPGERPICEVNGACRGCQEHGECDSGACDLAAGACVDPANIAYVDASASDANTTCTETSKCRTITRGLMAGGGTLAYVVIAGGSYMEDVAIAGRTVTLIGYGAELRAQTNGFAAISVTGASGTVEVLGMELRQSATGLDCSGSVGSTVTAVLIDVLVTTHAAVGVSAFRCDLVMKRTRVSGAVEGGVALNLAGFDITNSIIDGNGAAGAFGGISIIMPQPSPQRIEFNTIVDNQGASGTNARGIDCDAIDAMPPFRNNLITGNTDPGGVGQVTGMPNCGYQYSLINPEVTGEGNTSGLPDFVGADYRIGAASDAIDSAGDNSGASRVPDDIDGDDRPMTGADIGADEYVPPS
jgi:hypothetical protein